jgi:23S rRNA (adenine2030-N6)-methyltransferase
MNYRHAFHSGNFADVMKHSLIARILIHLNAKDAAYRYLDTHAGVGIYDLAAEAPSRTLEWRDGIGRLEQAILRPDEAILFAPYLDCIRELRLIKPALYPGSPEFARRLSRPQDRLTLVELHREDAEVLRRSLPHDTRVTVLPGDGWTALKACLPPKERRGLVLIDPPFEEPGEFERLQAALKLAGAKWRTGIYALWYPIKSPARSDTFCTALGQSGLKKLLRLELLVRNPVDPARLNGSGLLVLNPPWRFENEAELILQSLARILAANGEGKARIDWLARE